MREALLEHPQGRRVLKKHDKRKIQDQDTDYQALSGIMTELVDDDSSGGNVTRSGQALWGKYVSARRQLIAGNLVEVYRSKGAPTAAHTIDTYVKMIEDALKADDYPPWQRLPLEMSLTYLRQFPSAPWWQSHSDESTTPKENAT